MLVAPRSPRPPLPGRTADLRSRISSHRLLTLPALFAFVLIASSCSSSPDRDHASRVCPSPELTLRGIHPDFQAGPKAHAVRRGIEWQIRHFARQGYFTRFAAAVVIGDRVAYRYLYNTKPEWVFGTASITKTFTALAVMRLVSAGKARLDDPVRKHLPELQIASEVLGSDPVTIRDLLSHTSGLPDMRYYEPRYWRTAHGVSYPNQVYPTGLHYRYSNHGFIILGRLVEELSGMSLSDFMHRNVFRPLCMPHARTSRRHSGAQGVNVSIDDLAHYASFWLQAGRTPRGTRLLRVATVAEMLRPRTVIPYGENQRFAGLGWRVRRSGETVATFFHIGGAPYVTAWIQMFPEANAAILYLGNPPKIDLKFGHFYTSMQKRLATLATRLVEAGRPLHFFQADRPNHDQLRRYTGLYRSPRTGQRLRAYLRRGRLYITGPEGFARLYPFSTHVFQGGEDYTFIDFVYRSAEQDHPTAIATHYGYFQRME